MKQKYLVLLSKAVIDIKEVQTLGLYVRLLNGELTGFKKEDVPLITGMSKTAFSKAWNILRDLGYVQLEAETLNIVVHDIPDPLHNHSAVPDPDPFKAHPLVDWLWKECPRVQRMKQPITQDQAIKLMSEYQKEPLKDVFKGMENRGNLHKAYVSANLTVRSWIDDQFKTKLQAEPTGYSPH